MSNNSTDDTTRASRPLWIKLWPLYILGGGLIAAWRFGLFSYFSEEGLRTFYETQQETIANNLFLSLAIYILVYAAATLFMMPGALWLTIAGGLLFGLALGVPATIIGATLGASLLFFASRTSLGGALRKLAGPHVAKVEDEFKQSPMSYLFAIRFLPLVPFPVANVLPAVLGAKYWQYALTTALGIIPGVLAYSWVGAGVRGTFAEGGEFNLAAAAANLAPAGIALLVVSLMPIAYKKLFTKSSNTKIVEPHNA